MITRAKARFIGGLVASIILGTLCAIAEAQQKSGEARKHNQRGRLYYNQGNYGKAAEEFQQAVTLSPNDVEARANLASAYERLDRLDEAEREITIAITKRPDRAANYGVLGAVYAKRGKRQEAVHAFKKELALKPTYWRRHADLGRLYEDLGQIGDAKQEYELYLTHAPKGEDLTAEIRRRLLTLDSPRRPSSDVGGAASVASAMPQGLLPQDEEPLPVPPTASGVLPAPPADVAVAGQPIGEAALQAPGGSRVPAPPDVIISYPEDRMKVAGDAVILAGIVRSPNSVARVSIAVNGNELPTSGGLSRGSAGTKTLPLSIRIPLQVGENVIVLTAFDESGEASQAIRTVYREAALPSGQIQEAARPIPGGSMERWAVVIGIDRYRDASITELQYAAADANAFYNFLITKGGVKPNNARLLLNKDATQVNIRRALGDFLKQKALKEDEVIIYYAGHGTTDPEPTAEGGLAKYLVPWDADPTSLFATGIPMEEIDHIFARLAARKILLVQDTCFSGGAGGRTFVRRGLTRAGTLTDKFLQDLASRQGRMVLTASDANQLSLESPELGHGLFTHYLLQALAGAADLDSDGAITTREVHLYLQRKVHEHSGGNQTPQLYSIGDMVIVRVN